MAQTLDRILFSNQQTSIGLFDCPVTSPDFNNTGPIQGYLLAFPRTAVKIRHADMKESFVADPNIVTIYNKGQEYERYSLSLYGDRCDWLSVSTDTIRKILCDLGDHHLGERDELFSFSRSVSTPFAYRMFRQLVGYLSVSEKPDALAVDEVAITIFRQVIETAYRNWGIKTRPKRQSTTLRHQRLVMQTQEFLAVNYCHPLSLDKLSSELNTSAYHLCRVFRRVTHQSVHQYLNQLRLREALNCISMDTDFATLGIKLGFSDHSHFSLSFRKSFNVTPSDFRLSSKAEQLFRHCSK